MGFCRLLKIILSVFAVAVLTSGAAAETFQGSASATIQVTATVVPSVGMYAPDDALLVSTSGAGKALGLYETNQPTESSSLPGQLVMQCPSSGILLSVSDSTGETDRFSLESASAGLASGATLVDLARVCRDAATETGDITLTIIYTEN